MAITVGHGGRAASLGSAFGTGIAAPIKRGLDLLAENKFLQLQGQHKAQQDVAERKRYAQGLAPLLGDQTAGFLSNLNPEERKYALQNIGGLMQLSQSGGLQNSGLESLVQQPQQSSGLNTLTDKPVEQMTPDEMLEASGMNEKMRSGSRPINDKNNLIQDIFTSPQEKRQRQLLDIQKEGLELKKGAHQLKERKAEREESKEARDFSKPYIERAEKSRANIRDYEQLVKLSKKGNLRAGSHQQLLAKFGLEDFLRNYDTEVAGKLIARLAQNVSGAFGTNSRVTNFLEQTFQRSLPSLWNTPKGIEAIANLNMTVDKANLIKDDIRKKIIKDHHGELPFDLEDQIIEQGAPKIAKLENDAFASIGGNSSSPAMKSLPSASENKGRKIRNKETGDILISNGSNWVKE